MSDSFVTVAIRGDQEVAAGLDAFATRLRDNLRRAIAADTAALEQLVLSKLSGGVLQQRSGTLYGAVKSDVSDSSDEIGGRVYIADGAVPYAAIQEYGGVTRAHVIEPRNAQALSFAMGGRAVFAKRVNHPGSKIPSRSYVRSSLADMRDDIIADLKGAVSDARPPGGS